MDEKIAGRRKHKNDKHRDSDEEKSKRARPRTREDDDDKRSYRKRKQDRSKSPDKNNKINKQYEGSKEPDIKPEPPERKRKETDMVNTRTGGAYIPPARLRMMQAQITDKSSIAYQRLAWEALKKSIHGHINKINVGNIGIIIKELLKENIVRGRGLLCRSVIQAQAASPTFTNVYAALVAAVNSRFPNIGELLLKRLVIQFKRGFKRNDKPICISAASFIAHLVNQRVAHEILALELLTLLVESPTDDSVEVAISFLKECGQKLTEVSSKGVNAIFEMLRNILHEGQLDKRVQYMIEVMFQVWKDGFKDHPAVIEELELVPEEEQFTHLLMLDDATDGQDILNVFKLDEKYEENEDKYKKLCKEILGSDAESGDEEGSGSEGDSDEDEDEEDTDKPVTIIDNTETNLVALRRTIYLTINSSLDFEECAHKLMKMQLKPGQEIELCHMFLDCCAEQRTYEKFYGLLAQRFCNINRIYIDPFEQIFKESYSTAHRLDMNRLRNVSKFFAHLLFTDSISWEVLDCVKLNEEDTTSSSRIYIKILFQELAEYMGLKKLNDRLRDPTLQEAFHGLFPRDNPKNTRFSINFFTSIGLGGLTDELREHLKQMPKNIPPPVTDIKVGSSSSESSSSSSESSSSESSSSSSNEEDQEVDKKKKQKKKSKDKSPKTPALESGNISTERWGHNGFYETYGEDATRHQPNNNRNDEFARPREPTERPYRKREDKNNKEKTTGRTIRDNNERRSDHYDGNDGPRDDKRYRDDSRKYRNDEARNHHSDRSDPDSNRRDRDNNRRDRDNDRRDRNNDRRDRDSDRRDRDNDRRDRDNDRRDRDSDRRDRNSDTRDFDSSKRIRDDDRRLRDESKRRECDDKKQKEDKRGDDEKNSKDEDKRSREYVGKKRKDGKKSSQDDEKRTRDEDKRSLDNDKSDKRGDSDDNRKICDGYRRGRDDRRGHDDDKRKRDIDRKKRDEDRQGDKYDKKEQYTKITDKNSRDRKNYKNKKKIDSDKSSSSSSSESDGESDICEKQRERLNDGWDIRGNSIRRETPPRYWQ